ncbi:MAG: hypothetical protein ACOC4C_01685 [Fibrobacterota bacterium]
MQLKIELSNEKFFSQQSIPVYVRMVNGPEDATIPYRFSETDVFTFELSNEQGKVLSKADGYTAVERRGRKVIKTPQNKLQTKKLKAYEKMEIKEELLRFIPVNGSGSYNLKALFRFEPQGISLISNTVSFHVKENHCTWFDFNDSENVFFFIQYTGNSLIGHISSRKKTLGFRKGAAVSRPDLPEGLLSESDFVVRPDDTMHNYYRWILFKGETELMACKFYGDTFSEFYSDTFTSPSSIIGRPVQHQDYSLSVTMISEKKKVHRIKYDCDFNFIKDDHLINLDFIPRIITAETDIFERFYLAHDTEKVLPIKLKTFENNTIVGDRNVIDKKDIPFFSKDDTGTAIVTILSLNVSVRNHNAMALLALLLVGNEWTSEVYMIKAPIDPAEKDNMVLIKQPVGGLLIEENEEVIAGHIVEDNKRLLHAVFCSTHGKVFYSKQGQYPECVLTMTENSKFPQLLVTLRGDIHLIYNEPGFGIKQQVLHRMPKR